MITIKVPGKIFGISKVIFTIKLHTYTYIHTIFRHALGCFYLPSQRVNLFCSLIFRWMSNITILNVSRPNFSSEFRSTPFSLVL